MTIFVCNISITIMADDKKLTPEQVKSIKAVKTKQVTTQQVINK